jgi:hypothetical protein
MCESASIKTVRLSGFSKQRTHSELLSTRFTRFGGTRTNMGEKDSLKMFSINTLVIATPQTLRGKVELEDG